MIKYAKIYANGEIILEQFKEIALAHEEMSND